jgi:Poly A polymerase head domain
VSFPARLEIPDDVLEIARTLEAAGHEAWCVGGAVRDTLLGEYNTDYDIATSARPEEVKALFRNTAAVGERFGTVGVRTRRRHHEVTTFRKDVLTDGRHAVVEFGASLEEDLARRDFTINAIAYDPLRHQWRDPFDGAADLGTRGGDSRKTTCASSGPSGSPPGSGSPSSPRRGRRCRAGSPGSGASRRNGSTTSGTRGSEPPGTCRA